jgi:hypothetical protein
LLIASALQLAQAGRNEEARKLIAKLRKVDDRTVKLAVRFLEAWTGDRPITHMNDLREFL